MLFARFESERPRRVRETDGAECAVGACMVEGGAYVQSVIERLHEGERHVLEEAVLVACGT